MKTDFRFKSLLFSALILLTSVLFGQNSPVKNTIPGNNQISLSKAQMDSMVNNSKRKSDFQWSINPRLLIGISEIRYSNEPGILIPSLDVLFGFKNKNYMLGAGLGFRYYDYNDIWTQSMNFSISTDFVISNRFFVNLNRKTALDFFFNTGIPLIDIAYQNEYYSSLQFSPEKKLFVYPKDQLDIPVSGGMGISFGEDKDVQVEIGYATNLYLPSLYLSRINYLTIGVNVSF
jgi:hypothetical protein